ncbi:glycoside hydrolase family 3 N-terminal domain-containing protein [soil metagenome]
MPPGHSPPRRQFLHASGVSAASWLLALSSGGARAASRSEDEFIESLIGRMTLEEKAGQLNLLPDFSRPQGLAFNPELMQMSNGELFNEIAAGHITGLFNGTGVAGGRALQRVAVERSRLKIPLIFAADIIHGARTSFPVPLAEAAAFDADLAERTARAAAVEATAMGIQWTFGPMVDIARDQRWGRVVEGAGEDPYLGRLLAAARVRGFQGADLKNDDSMLSTMKHFAAYGAVSGGMEYNTSEIAETTLRDVHLPPFKAGIDAGAMSVMTGFNDIAGVPATGNQHLLGDILRGEWAFKGVVVSDYTSDLELVSHGYAADEKDAALKALLAGCDISMASGIYLRYLPALVREGSLPIAVLDRSVRRVLQVKQALGLFDNPYRSLDPVKERTALRTPQTVTLAREAARRSVVLLKNEGGLLPLPAKGRRITLIGPFANDRANLAGPWTLFADRSRDVSLAQGLRSAMAEPGALQVVQGSDVNAPVAGGIQAAVRAARRADVVILALGENENMSGEARSRVDVDLPAAQMALAEAVAAVGKPVVVVLRHGRALALHGAVAKAPSIMAGWFLGCETGNALADLIFGSHSPSGRLPVSFPQHSGQQPFFYNHRPTGRAQRVAGESYRARYVEVANEALYPFGHGLGYGQIEYGPTQLDSRSMGWDGELNVSTSLTNRGRRGMREVAQLYVHQRVSRLTRAVRELKAFAAVNVEPGETATVRFKLRRSDLVAIQPDLAFAAEPGWFDIVVAPNASAGQFAAFELLKPQA